METVGIREVKNGFSALTARVNETGRPLSVLKNNRPWVVIYPADAAAKERRAKRALFEDLTKRIEQQAAADPIWDEKEDDKDLLATERMRCFG